MQGLHAGFLHAGFCMQCVVIYKNPFPPSLYISGGIMDNKLADLKPSTGSIRCVNVVSVTTLGTRLDLEMLPGRISGATYNPKKLNAVIIRLKVPKVTCLVFRSGSVTCAGADSIHWNRFGVKRCIRKIRSYFPEVSMRSYRVVNMVASCSMGFRIDLERLRFEHQPKAIFEPELFAGLTLRLTDPKVTAVIFRNGKFQIVGCTTHSQVDVAYKRLVHLLHNYRNG